MVSRQALYRLWRKGVRNHLWVLPVADSGQLKPMQFLQTEFNEVHGQLSPDDRWMASDVSGQREVYARTFPSADHEIRISIAGGEQPRWRGDGKELFYVAADRKIHAVEVKTSSGQNPALEASTPVLLLTRTSRAASQTISTMTSPPMGNAS